jgi:hypothetical protein
MTFPAKGKLDQKQQQEAASALAVTALSFIAGEPERLGRFLAMSGIGPESIRDAANEPDFLLGVLDYLVSDEALLRPLPARTASVRTSPVRATSWQDRRSRIQEIRSLMSGRRSPASRSRHHCAKRVGTAHLAICRARRNANFSPHARPASGCWAPGFSTSTT